VSVRVRLPLPPHTARHGEHSVILTLPVAVVGTAQTPDPGPVIHGAAQRQHLIAGGFVPPGTGALEPDMTHECIRRFDAPTPQRIASAAKLAIVSPAPMVIKIYPAVVNRFERFCRRGLHAPQAPEAGPYLAHIQASQGRFDPL
jgi:hypothetical protein